MNEYEKSILSLLEIHKRTDKITLAMNINRIVYNNGIRRKGKNQWLSEVTGYSVGTVNAWFSRTKRRALNKVPLLAICRIAIALELSVWDFVDGKDAIVPKRDGSEIDRRSKLYWRIRRKEAEALWNDSHMSEKGPWSIQDMAVRREFLDRLYMERLETERKDGRHEKDMEAERDGKTH